MALAKRMNTGSVNINNVLMGAAQLAVPWEGWNDSGLGLRSGGASGIRKYCRIKSIVADRVAAEKEVNWYPYTAGREDSSRRWSGFSRPRIGGVDWDDHEQHQSNALPAQADHQ